MVGGAHAQLEGPRETAAVGWMPACIALMVLAIASPAASLLRGARIACQPFRTRLGP